MTVSTTNFHEAVILGCEAMKRELYFLPHPKTLEEKAQCQENMKAWVYAVRVLLEQAEQMRIGTSIDPLNAETSRIYRSRYSEMQTAMGDCTYGGFVQNVFNHAPAVRSKLNDRQLELWGEIDQLQDQLRNTPSKRSFDRVYRDLRVKMHEWDRQKSVRTIVRKMKDTTAFSLAWKHVIDCCTLLNQEPEARLLALKRKLYLK